MTTDNLYISPKQAFVAAPTQITFDASVPGALTVGWVAAANVLRVQVAFRKREQDHWEQTTDTASSSLTFTYDFEPGVEYEFKFVSYDQDGKQTYPVFLTYVVPTGEPEPVVEKITRPAPSRVEIELKPSTRNDYLMAYGNVLEHVDEYKLMNFTGDKVEVAGLDPDVTYRFVINKIYKKDFLPVNQYIEI